MGRSVGAARTTGITRLQQLGLDHGPRDVLHFVVEGDYGLAVEYEGSQHQEDRGQYLALVTRGYEGPPPELGELWAALFAPVAAVVRPGRTA